MQSPNALRTIFFRPGKNSLGGFARDLVAGLLLGLAGVFAFTGCETSTMTTLEANRGAYQEAREFLKVGITTREEVRAKYGKPREVIPYDKGIAWRYAKTETVVMNAYTRTPYGTDGSLMRDFGGYQHSVLRRTVLELFFDKAGILSYYRIYRRDPGGKTEVNTLEKPVRNQGAKK